MFSLSLVPSFPFLPCFEGLLYPLKKFLLTKTGLPLLHSRTDQFVAKGEGRGRKNGLILLTVPLWMTI